MDGVIDLTSDEAIPESQQKSAQRAAVRSTSSILNSESIQMVDSDSCTDENESEPDNDIESCAPLIQIGRGKYRNLRFKQVECKRAFRNAVLCKTFEPLDQVHDLDSVLNWIKKKLMVELPPLLQKHHDLRAWVSMLNTYDNIGTNETPEPSNSDSFSINHE